MKGKPNKFVLKPSNFADDIVQGRNCRKRAVIENRSDKRFKMAIPRQDRSGQDGTDQEKMSYLKMRTKPGQE